jgi:hypothetical protein
MVNQNAPGSTPSPLFPGIRHLGNALLAIDRIQADHIITAHCRNSAPLTGLGILIVPVPDAIGRKSSIFSGGIPG